MSALTAKAQINYTRTNKERLLTRFKNYLTENQETITAGMSMISGTSFYAYRRMPNR